VVRFLGGEAREAPGVVKRAMTCQNVRTMQTTGGTRLDILVPVT
jgi:hypothetical protein